MTLQTVADLLSLNMTANVPQLAVSGGFTATKLSADTKIVESRKLSTCSLPAIAARCCYALCCFVVPMSAVHGVNACLSAVIYFVFVVREGIFENFFFGCVGRQALLHLPFPLKK